MAHKEDIDELLFFTEKKNVFMRKCDPLTIIDFLFVGLQSNKSSSRE
jgi:hypothetical protein